MQSKILIYETCFSVSFPLFTMSKDIHLTDVTYTVLLVQAKDSISCNAACNLWAPCTTILALAFYF